MFFKLFAV